MKTQQYYLLKLAEEAAEIAQIALKSAQFGMDEIYPGQDKTNAERCHLEIDDLLAVIDVLNRDYDFGFVSSPDRRRTKEEKMKKWLNYSRQCGQVED